MPERRQGPGRPPLAGVARSVRMPIRATPLESAAWRAAAAHAGESFAAWAAEELNNAAAQRTQPDPDPGD